MLGVSLFISCKNKIQCVCVEKKKRIHNGKKNRYEIFFKNIQNLKEFIISKHVIQELLNQVLWAVEK